MSGPRLTNFGSRDMGNPSGQAPGTLVGVDEQGFVAFITQGETPLDISGQTEGNHTTSTLDLGTGLTIPAGIGVRFDQGLGWRYAIVDSYAAGVVTLKGWPAQAGVALTRMELTTEVLYLPFNFAGNYNSAEGDLFDVNDAGKFISPVSGYVVVALDKVQNKTDDGTADPGLNARIGGGSDCFSADISVDTTTKDSGVTAQPANCVVDRDDQIELLIDNTTPGSAADAEGLAGFLVLVQASVS